MKQENVVKPKVVISFTHSPTINSSSLELIINSINTGLFEFQVQPGLPEDFLAPFLREIPLCTFFAYQRDIITFEQDWPLFFKVDQDHIYRLGSAQFVLFENYKSTLDYRVVPYQVYFTKLENE